MVIAHHLMWTLYGWWLPNDPRGSTSTTIRSDLLTELGELHHGRKKVQPTSRDVRAFYENAAPLLKHPLLLFSPGEFGKVAQAFGDSINHLGYICYAAVIMPDHVHLCIRKHKHFAEDMIDNIQLNSRDRLIAQNLRPHDHPTWTHGGYKVFLDTPDDIRRTIHYINANPDKLRLPRQTWPWVAPYNNWPFHKNPQ